MSDVQYPIVSYQFVMGTAGELKMVMEAPEGEADKINGKITGGTITFAKGNEDVQQASFKVK